MGLPFAAQQSACWYLYKVYIEGLFVISLSVHGTLTQICQEGLT